MPTRYEFRNARGTRMWSHSNPTGNLGFCNFEVSRATKLQFWQKANLDDGHLKQQELGFWGKTDGKTGGGQKYEKLNFRRLNPRNR